MIQKIKRYLILASTSLALLFPAVGGSVVAYASAGAGCSGISASVSDGANSAIPNTGSPGTVDCTDTNGSAGEQGIRRLAAKITNIFSIIVGAAAVIMIIYGGFRYITSGGESGRVGAAKNALLYAIIGLVIVALAQLIIHFVLTQANNVTNGSVT
jgi:hypothetical protein